ncbi:hypothetical protein GGR42_002398 [Saonia flava]|uniref:Cytochrome c-552/4 domain-containing protein n=1 Tax=Saonia flava TaxID=523696 RepID=A0A846QSI7_9FLAO|nr:cytochrome c3 family protein [Saonia flava]NJB71936.1 hypothetical protein [Saonia flava]
MSKKNIKNGLIFFALLLLTYVWYAIDSRIESNYFQPKVITTHYNGQQYVGSETCKECHLDVYKSHLETAHYNTSAPVSTNSILGNFEPEDNTLSLQGVEYQMIYKNKGFYQEAIYKYPSRDKSTSKMDVVIGSGVKGQSYLTWEEDKLYQLQVSYYRPTNSWINSPSFPATHYKRPVSDDCLKCHVTFARNRDSLGKGNEYYRNQIIYGVDCERCHQPAARHVIYHRENPEEKEPKHILKFNELSRQHSLDACAQCHSGLRAQSLKGSPFSYVVGENLEEHSKNFYTNRPNNKLDVHANQYGLLTSSKCFIESENMDCVTCHNTHKNQRGNASYFNQKCLECHNQGSIVCGAEFNERKKMGNNCITCHMPVSPSKSMMVKLNDTLETSVYVRSHLIGIYDQKEALQE